MSAWQSVAQTQISASGPISQETKALHSAVCKSRLDMNGCRWFLLVQSVLPTSTEVFYLLTPEVSIPIFMT